MAEISNDVSKQAHLHTREAAAVSPFLQSVGTGFFISVSIFAIMAALRAKDFWTIPLLAFVLVSAGSWLWLQYRLMILTRLEVITGRDLDGDGYTGPAPEPEERVVKVVHEYRGQDGKLEKTTWTRYPSNLRMIALADALINKKVPFSMDALCPKYLSREEYIMIRDKMIHEEQTAHWRDVEKPKKGVELHTEAYEAFKEILNNQSPTG